MIAKNENKIINYSNKLVDFSKAVSVEEVFELLYNFLFQNWKIVELDLFLTLENNSEKVENNINKIGNNIDKIENISEIDNFIKVKNVPSSVSLRNIYNELEERGLLAFASNSKMIKIIPNIDDSIEQINSLIIVPIFLFNKLVAYFIANSPLHVNEIEISNLGIIYLIFEQVFALINIHNIIAEKDLLDNKYNFLKQQTLFASTHIAVSELLVGLNAGLEIPHKIIRTNLDLIQKGVGDIKLRLKIIEEQFNNIVKIQNKTQKLSTEIENISSSHDIFSIISEAINISTPLLHKFGVTLSTNLTDIGDKVHINCFRVQIIFSIYSLITKFIMFMQDGGEINIGLFKNDNRTISIIISSSGTGVNIDEISGNFISGIDLSIEKMRLYFLYTLAQQVIIFHKGKLSVYSESGKGTTYKIIFPVVS